jgi:hypothetical protein
VGEKVRGALWRRGVIAAAHPIWFAGSLACVLASGNLLVTSVHGRYAIQAWLAAVTFALWSVLAVVFYWGAA